MLHVTILKEIEIETEKFEKKSNYIKLWYSL